MPEITPYIIEDGVSTGPYGAKGVGEISSINTMPAICNAVYNATGVRIHKAPIDQDALARAIKAKQAELHASWDDVR